MKNRRPASRTERQPDLASGALDARSSTGEAGRSIRAGTRPRRFTKRRVMTTAMVSGVALVAVAVTIAVNGPAIAHLQEVVKARAEASAAYRALQDGDLLALDRELSSNRADADFAYYFTKKTTPRDLGDVLATAANADVVAKPGSLDLATEVGPTKSESDIDVAELDSATYDQTLNDLAGTLALATHGTGDRELPDSWTKDFVTSTTTPQNLYPKQPSDAKARSAQDVANKQNLLLLLSRGHWSTDFLKATTTTYWNWERAPRGDADRGPWPGNVAKGADYAPAPNGTYLTDGMAALAAALTVNPEAASWAFTEFKPGTTSLNFAGGNHQLGNFAHYLFFERPDVVDSEAEAEAAHKTVFHTALMSAATYDAGEPGNAAAGGLLADLKVLEDYAVAQTVSQDSGAWYERWWNAATGWVQNSVEFVKGQVLSVPEMAQAWWGTCRDPEDQNAKDYLTTCVHPVLAVVGFIPVVGVGADAAEMVLYAIEGDYANAGLSAAFVGLQVAVIVTAGGAATAVVVAKTADASKDAAKAADAAKDAAKAADAVKDAAKAGDAAKDAAKAGDAAKDAAKAADAAKDAAKAADKTKDAAKVGDSVKDANKAVKGFRVTNAKGVPYPDFVDPRTGRAITGAPKGLSKVAPELRDTWASTDRLKFIKEWNGRGLPEPKGGWKSVDIHHIRPLEYGGKTEFDNLVPLLKADHQKYTSWWRNYVG